MLGSIINLGTGHTTRVAEAAGIRKNVMKEKTVEDKLIDIAKEVAKQREAKPEEGGSDKEKKDEGNKEKPTS